MIGNSSAVILGGGVRIMTTSGRGFTPEEISERALDKIIAISDKADPVIKKQAKAFREDIKHTLIHYMNEAIKSNKVTLINKLKQAGHSEAIKILEK
mgnify:CR=1 FL=1|jgi:hypothetical protein